MKSANPNDKVLTNALMAYGMESGAAAKLDLGEVLEHALARGGSFAELFFEDTDSTRLFYEGGKVDRVQNGRDGGVGLRILADGKTTYGYSTNLSQESLVALADTLAAAVPPQKGPKATVRTDWREAKQSAEEIARYRIQRSPRDLSLAEKAAVTRRMDAAARADLPEARQVMCAWLDSYRNLLVVTSDGLVSRDSKVYLHFYTQVVGAKDGRVESAIESEGGYVGLEFLDAHPPEAMAREAARRVKVLLDAKPAPAGTMAVVLSAEAGGTMIHEAVGHGLEADLACNGLSVYQGKVGTQVASPLITVVDDGTMPERRGSYAFDDEGTPSQKTVLIENGILKGYLVDRLSAMKFDMMATGNGRRESFRHKPIVRMTNTYIAPGKHDPAQILAETKQGVFVKAMGGGQVNTVTGDFVFAVTEGYLIHDGKLGAPIRGATLVGNGPRVLAIVDRVGTDLGFATGTCGKDGQGAPVTDAQPTLRIPELTVGGEVPMTDYWQAV